jgi:hypothetical protein
MEKAVIQKVIVPAHQENPKPGGGGSTGHLHQVAAAALPSTTRGITNTIDSSVGYGADSTVVSTCEIYSLWTVSSLL